MVIFMWCFKYGGFPYMAFWRSFWCLKIYIGVYIFYGVYMVVFHMWSIIWWFKIYIGEYIFLWCFMVVLKRRNGLVCFQNIFGEIYFMEFPCGVFKGIWNGEKIYFGGKYIYMEFWIYIWWNIYMEF